MNRIVIGKKRCKLMSDDGSILIVALIMLVLITLMGISATSTTNIELQIAGNDMLQKVNLYNAEASSMIAVQVLDGTDLETPPSWVAAAGSVPLDDIRGESFWGDGGGATITVQSPADSNSRYVAVYEGIDEVGSLDMAKAKIHQYSIYGRSKKDNGVKVIRVGFKKAF